MKILFLIPYPLKEAPSQRFRFEQYFNVLHEKGFEIATQSFWDKLAWPILYKPGYTFRKIIGFIKGLGRRLAILFRHSKFDYVFIHRECLPVGPPIVEWILAKLLRKKIIYDFDDAIWLPNTSEENKLAAFLKWHSKVASICKWSYRVSCGNSFLADYARQFNTKVVINPTTIDTNHFHNPKLFPAKKKSNAITIGWTGTQSTLPYLISLVPIIEKLEAKYPGQIRLLVIANKDPKLGLNFIDFLPWSKETEIEDLLRIDIGVMPLHDDPWAKGKCGFKALQYMALEIPALASPVGVNVEIIDNGVNGILCQSDHKWIKQIEALMTNESERKQIGSMGRKKVISNYSVSSNSSTFLGLFSL